MKWNEFSHIEQQAILRDASETFAIDASEGTSEAPVLGRVSNADLARYAMGLSSAQPISNLKMALRTDKKMRARFDRIMDLYSKLVIPVASAASSAADFGRRRDPNSGLEVEWVNSSVEPNSIIVKIFIPEVLRPVSRLILRQQDSIAEIYIPDDDLEDIVEVLIDRASDEFRLLSDGETRLWLS